jgi:DNA polymerase-1
MPIQGTAADMIKLAMIRVDKCLTASQLPARMLLQVHDELLFEVDEAAVDALTELVSREMIAALTLQVPIEVDTGTGKNWLDAH